MTTRRNRRRSELSTTLPDELRSFDTWLYPSGLHDYMAALSRFLVDGQRLTPVMNAAGLSTAEWFRRMLSGSTRSG